MTKDELLLLLQKSALDLNYSAQIRACEKLLNSKVLDNIEKH